MTTPEATLSAVDAALEEGRVTRLDPDERELQELALALRAETPEPTAEFEARLERKLAAGFPRRRRLAASVPRLTAAMAAVSILVALVVGVAVFSGGGTKSSSSGSTVGSEPSIADSKAPAAESTPAAGGKSVAAAPAPAPARSRRRVERSASLILGAPGNELESVGNEVIAVTDRHHGFVLHSSVTSGSSDPGGSFDLRVPSRELQGTLSDLSGLADVRSRTQNADDITSSYNAAADQLAAARALRQSLLAQLAKATTVSQADALQHRIKLVSAQIRSLSARFDNLQRRARYASIQVDLVRERAKHGATTGGLGGDFHDALGTLAASFGIALRVLGVGIPLAIVAGLGWAAGLALRRRRRETALDF